MRNFNFWIKLLVIVVLCLGAAKLSGYLYDDWKDSQVSSPIEAKGIWDLEYDSPQWQIPASEDESFVSQYNRELFEKAAKKYEDMAEDSQNEWERTQWRRWEDFYRKKAEGQKPPLPFP